MPLIEQLIHTDDLRDEQRRARGHFWYYLCLYVEDEREDEGVICDALEGYLNIINRELEVRDPVKHWIPRL